jgi:hypothetical protein
MILFLRCFFIVVLASILGTTLWAASQCPLFSIPREVVTHPWFIATLVDAYLGFLTFYVWVFFQQTAWLSRLTWLVAILLLGNIAMAIYCLVALFRVPLSASLATVLTTRTDRTGPLGPILAAAGIGVLFIA